MSKLYSRLLVLVFLLGLLSLFMSCSQTDDITAPKSLTKIWLDPDRLPPASVGMIYELWASKVDVREINDLSQVISAGQFSFFSSDTLITFLDETDNVRADSNLFVINDDLFSYSYLFVSIEPRLDTIPLPGPAMLIDRVTGETDTLDLYFPQHDSLFNSTVRCNFETPTDGNRFNDGFGLWFSNYQATTDTIVDTNGVEISYYWQTILPNIDPQTGDTLNLTSLYKPYPDSVWVIFDTVMIDFGKDRLPLGIDSVHFFHNAATQMIRYEVDSTIPRVVKNYDTGIVYDTVIIPIQIDAFSQDMYGLPNLEAYGWQYKGWIVHNNILPAAVGNFTPPGWDFQTGDLLIPGYAGGLLTTGVFYDITKPDLSNPFTEVIEWEVDSGSFIDTVLKRPSYPGEDFINGAAISAATNGVYNAPIDLLPGTSNGSNGTVFVSLEPVNMVHDSTNFPLIAFGFQLPSSESNGFLLANGWWPLLNWTGTATGTNGFPKLKAMIQRL
jgi:hypothetical protein